MATDIELQDGKKVSMRNPVMRDIRLASGKYNPHHDPVGYEMYLIANLSGMTMDEVDELDPRDYKKFVEQVTPFLSR